MAIAPKVRFFLTGCVSCRERCCLKQTRQATECVRLVSASAWDFATHAIALCCSAFSEACSGENRVSIFRQLTQPVIKKSQLRCFRICISKWRVKIQGF